MAAPKSGPMSMLQNLRSGGKQGKWGATAARTPYSGPILAVDLYFSVVF